jgi:hypothetical protein
MKKKKSKEKLSAEQFWDHIKFEQNLIDVKLWIEKADQLVNAAEVIAIKVKEYWQYLKVNNGEFTTEKSSRFPLLQDIYFMLNAFALENYFKAIIVFQKPELSKRKYELDFGDLPKELNSHNLNYLANKTSFKKYADIGYFSTDLFNIAGLIQRVQDHTKKTLNRESNN